MESSKKMEGFGFGAVLAVVVGVIGLTIVNTVLTDANFTGLLGTVTDNVPIIAGLSLLVIAAGGLIALR